MTIAFRIIIISLFVIVAAFITGAAYTVKEYHQVVITEFGKPIGEPIARGGPFVMNTKSEILEAIQDYNNGTFAKY